MTAPPGKNSHRLWDAVGDGKVSLTPVKGVVTANLLLFVYCYEYSSYRFLDAYIVCSFVPSKHILLVM